MATHHHVHSHTDQADAIDNAASAPPLTTLQVVGSTLAAGLGVQSRENKVRDFEQGKMSQFIVAGLVFTGLFLAGLITLVNVIVSSQG